MKLQWQTYVICRSYNELKLAEIYRILMCLIVGEGSYKVRGQIREITQDFLDGVCVRARVCVCVRSFVCMCLWGRGVGGGEFSTGEYQLFFVKPNYLHLIIFSDVRRNKVKKSVC